MNKLIYSVLAASALVALPAQALTIAQVGGFDTLVASTTLANSGDAEELSWAQSAVRTYTGDNSIELVLDFKDESGSASWTQVDQGTGDGAQADQFYYDFGTVAENQPDYYLIKLGTSNKQDYDTHHLYDNLESFQYGLVDFSDMGLDFTINGVNVGIVSHTNTYGDGQDGGDTTNPPPNNEVPEPSTYAMFGMAFAMFAFMRYRARSRKS